MGGFIIFVNYNNIVNNLNYLTNKYNKKLFFVVKNNGYNTDLKQLVVHTTNAGFTHFAVTTVKEAIIIKKCCPNAYVLAMNPTNEAEIILAKDYEIALSITSYEWYLKYKDVIKDLKLHLKVNFGMNRFGINDINQINELIESNSNIEGLFTHFPLADMADLTLHYQQVEVFTNIFKKIISKKQLKYIHSENSAALMLKDDSLKICNFARVGIIVYGYSPTTFDQNLKPSIYLFAKVISLKSVKANEYVGYGLDNKLTKDCIIAIIDIGYGDGLSKLRSLLPVTINNTKYKILTISMSHTILLVDKKVNIEDSVEIYGDNHRIDHLLDVTETTCSIHMSTLHLD
ncbi:alanine racemase [Mycoplasma sp. P36-A1]|uniref:alanine racemase n=1 Tax=Mycoplasma sp. P36-A1 TaxID=3252900 RepID=UPI003C2BED69